MKVMVKFLVLVLAFGVSAGVSAQGKIAVVDMRAAILGTDLARQRMTALSQREEFAANVRERDALVEQYNRIAEEFQREYAVLNAQERAEFNRRLEAKGEDIQHVARKVQAAEQELVQQLGEELGERAQQILGELVRSEGIGLLLNRQAVLHADSSFNLTSKVTDRLNQAR